MNILVKVLLLLLFFPIFQVHGQFSALLKNNSLSIIKNDSLVLVAPDGIRGKLTWQISENGTTWADTITNADNNTLTLLASSTFYLRLKVKENNCVPIYSDRYLVFSGNTTVEDYVNHPDVDLVDLVDIGINVNELFDLGFKKIPFVDHRDGKKYDMVEMGDQIWMADNLAYDTGEGSYIYDNSKSNESVYGRLYTYEAANSACPSGWHLPSNSEWNELINYIDDNSQALKDTTTWIENGGTLDQFHFSAPASGYLLRSSFGGKGYVCWFWTSTEVSGTRAYIRKLDFEDYVILATTPKSYGYSIRCVKD